MKIIDNRTTKLTDEVNDLLGDTTFSKMAVGYFYLSGFDAIKQRLNKVKSLKLLIGNSTNQATADELIAGFARLDMVNQSAEQLEFLNRDQIKAILEESMVAMRAQLEQMPQTDNDEQGVKSLAQLIAEKRVEVRVFTRGFMHSKAYLFEYEPGTSWHDRYKGAAIVGSSNLSHGGLVANTANSGTYSLNDIEDLESYDVVLIDESHNFRKPDTDRYKILQPYLRERKVILLTATPQNKSVWDYYHQIQLFHQQERTSFPISTARLDTFFKECEKRPAQVSQLLDHVLIRRRDIVDIYKPMLHDKPVRFPKRKLTTWGYEIEKTYQSGIYDEVVRTLRADLQFARYGLAEYLRTNLDHRSQIKERKSLSRGNFGTIRR